MLLAYVGVLRDAHVQLRRLNTSAGLPLTTYRVRRDAAHEAPRGGYVLTTRPRQRARNHGAAGSQLRTLAGTMAELARQVEFLRLSYYDLDAASVVVLEGWVDVCEVLAHLLGRVVEAADAQAAPAASAPAPSLRLWALRATTAPPASWRTWRCHQLLAQADALDRISAQVWARAGTDVLSEAKWQGPHLTRPGSQTMRGRTAVFFKRAGRVAGHARGARGQHSPAVAALAGVQRAARDRVHAQSVARRTRGAAGRRRLRDGSRGRLGASHRRRHSGGSSRCPGSVAAVGRKGGTAHAGTT